MLDEAHLLAALRYVSPNPVRAGLVQRAEHWPWSSVLAHLAERDDGVVSVAPALERVGPFGAFLDIGFDETETHAALRRSETSGRPAGGAEWVSDL